MRLQWLQSTLPQSTPETLAVMEAAPQRNRMKAAKKAIKWA